MELAVADGSKVHQDHAAVGLLQGDGGIDGGGGRARASLGAEEGKNAGLARSSASASAVGTETRQGLEKSLSAGAVIEIFTGPGAHAGHDGGGLLHGSVGKDGELESVGLDKFDGFDGGLRIRGRDIDHDHLGAQVLNLPQDGIRGSERKADVREHYPGQLCSLQAILQLRQVFPVLGQKGYGDAMHGAVLADFSRCLHVRKRKYPSPSDSGNRAKAGEDVTRAERPTDP